MKKLWACHPDGPGPCPWISSRISLSALTQRYGCVELLDRRVGLGVEPDALEQPGDLVVEVDGAREGVGLREPLDAGRGPAEARQLEGQVLPDRAVPDDDDVHVGVRAHLGHVGWAFPESEGMVGRGHRGGLVGASPTQAVHSRVSMPSRVTGRGLA